MRGLSRRAMARLGAVGATVALVAGPATAAAAASTPTVDGYAYGVDVVGQGAFTPTPVVTLPPGGSAPISQQQSEVISGGLVVQGLSVTTRGATTAPQPHQSASIAQLTDASLEYGGAGPLDFGNGDSGLNYSSCQSGTQGSTGGFSLYDISIDNTSYPSNPGPNTTYQLPVSFGGSAGTVTFNKRTVTSSAGSTSITVDIADIKLTSGVEYIIGESHCSAEGPDVQVPVGAAGGVLLAAMVGVGFIGYQWRHRRHARAVV